jgi:hypothetical protein
MADNNTSGGQAAFLDRVLDSTPKWAMGFLGIMFGFSLCFIAVMTLGDLKAPFNRVIDAQVTRLEKSVDSLETITNRINNLEARVTELEVASRRYHPK